MEDGIRLASGNTDIKMPYQITNSNMNSSMSTFTYQLYYDAGSITIESRSTWTFKKLFTWELVTYTSAAE